MSSSRSSRRRSSLGRQLLGQAEQAVGLAAHRRRARPPSGGRRAPTWRRAWRRCGCARASPSRCRRTCERSMPWKGRVSMRPNGAWRARRRKRTAILASGRRCHGARAVSAAARSARPAARRRRRARAHRCRARARRRADRRRRRAARRAAGTATPARLELQLQAARRSPDAGLEALAGTARAQLELRRGRRRRCRRARPARPETRRARRRPRAARGELRSIATARRRRARQRRLRTRRRPR